MITADLHTEHTPFALTDIQQAYWIGEQQGYQLNTPAVLYRSFAAPGLDVARLRSALADVVRAHPALRTRILADGTQQTEPVGPPIELSVSDCGKCAPQERDAILASRKRTLMASLPPLDAATPFCCSIDRFDDGAGGDAYYLHFILRLIALDGRSIVLFFRDLVDAYQGLAPAAPTESPMRRFVAERAEVRRSADYQHALGYWKGRVGQLPAAPELPMVDHAAIPPGSDFRRLQLRLDPTRTARLQQQARACGVTLNALLCTAYADVLRLWSRNPAFTLNLLISQRPSGPQYAGALGNFSNTLLLEVQSAGTRFGARAMALQLQLYRDLAQAQVSGVEVIRALGRGADSLPAMPVVFASTLGLDGGGDTLRHRDLGWSVQDGCLHTPQVWLDHQVYMDEGQLVLNWDAADGVFLPGVADDMFGVYTRHLDAIAAASAPQDAALVPALPQRLLAARIRANETDAEQPGGLLHDAVARACRQHGTRDAIISAARTLTYEQLWRYYTTLAARLRSHGVGAGDLVAVLATRGWRQVSATLATLQAGGAYLPIAAELPLARKNLLINQAGVKVVLAERSLLSELAPASGQVMLALEDVLPDAEPAQGVELASVQRATDLAYVIFTSGSTGQPKGVAIDHRGAVNTLQDMVARFGLAPQDRVIGISALNFDLSVYDIFATLGCGAALVLPAPSATPAPHDWGRCVREHGVTVWNTVPALLEMQIEFVGSEAARELATLRLVLLSGDWIAVSLPARLAAAAPMARLVGLGGATEASIWSNYFDIKRVDPRWTSIPYGWPLANQSMHVLDHALQPAPNWVAGALYIGGAGLAHSYYQDPQRTMDSFIYHPQTGERLYRTGDLGRYHPSGYIEFLGRNDNQVKIRGFRIELGEIDTALERCAGVRSGAAAVRATGANERQLVAFFVRDGSPEAATEASVRASLAAILPDYMVPALIVDVAQLPVTANGKVDRAALLASVTHLQVERAASVAPRNETERRVAAIWAELLGIDTPCVHDDFFALGGTSLLAVRLLNAISKRFGRQLPLASLLRHGTVAAQAALVQEAGASAREPLVPVREGNGPLLVAVHPVGGNVLCYRGLAEFLPAEMAVSAMQSPGNGETRTVASLAAAYVAALVRHAGARPIHLLGWSMGGVIAHEMAAMLEEQGRAPVSLTLIDSWTGDPQAPGGSALAGYKLVESFVGDFLDGAPLPSGFAALRDLSPEAMVHGALALLRAAGSSAGELSAELFASLMAEHQANFNALIIHRPRRVACALRQYRATRSTAFAHLVPFEAGSAPATRVDEDHFSIFARASLRRIIEAGPWPLPGSTAGNAASTPLDVTNKEIA